MSESSLPTVSPGEREKVRDRVQLVVVLTVFLDLVGFGITIPLLPFYVTSMAPAEWAETVTGLCISSYSFMQAIATPWLGRWSDRYGRRWIILSSLLGNAASMVLFALAVHWHMLWLLFVSRMFAGATAGNLSACQAALADCTTKAERATAMGRLGAGIGLGMIIGPVIGAVTGKFADWAPPVAAAVMALLDLLLAAALMPETRHLQEKQPEGAKKTSAALGALIEDRRIAAVIGMYFLTFMAMTVLNVAFPYVAKDRFHWGKVEVGYMFGLFGISGVVIQGFLIKRLAGRFSETSLVMMAALFMISGLLFAGLSTHPWMLVVGNFVMGVGVAINNPSISTLASKLAPSEHQGAVLGYAQSAGSWARTFWPATWGFLYGHLAPVAPFVGAACAAFALFSVASTLRKMGPPPVSIPSGQKA